MDIYNIQNEIDCSNIVYNGYSLSGFLEYCDSKKDVLKVGSEIYEKADYLFIWTKYDEYDNEKDHPYIVARNCGPYEAVKKAMLYKTVEFVLESRENNKILDEYSRIKDIIRDFKKIDIDIRNESDIKKIVKRNHPFIDYFKCYYNFMDTEKSIIYDDIVMIYLEMELSVWNEIKFI